jgi:hypothetical protein
MYVLFVSLSCGCHTEVGSANDGCGCQAHCGVVVAYYYNVVQHFHRGIVFDSEILAWRNELETLATDAYLQYSSRIDY